MVTHPGKQNMSCDIILSTIYMFRSYSNYNYTNTVKLELLPVFHNVYHIIPLSTLHYTPRHLETNIGSRLEICKLIPVT